MTSHDIRLDGQAVDRASTFHPVSSKSPHISQDVDPEPAELGLSGPTRSGPW